MKKSSKNSRLEIWSAAHVNKKRVRRDNEESTILQIEQGNNTDTYIVEVLDKDKKVGAGYVLGFTDSHNCLQLVQFATLEDAQEHMNKQFYDYKPDNLQINNNICTSKCYLSENNAFLIMNENIKYMWSILKLEEVEEQ